MAEKPAKAAAVPILQYTHTHAENMLGQVALFLHADETNVLFQKQ